MKLAGIERRTAFALGALGVAAIFLAMPALAYTETAEPDAFLEYIEATGTQYIDTGVYIGKPDSFANVRLYSLKLREKQQNGKYELVRALVPVSDPLTGGVALWDKVTEKYYRSRGNLRLAGGGAERPLHVGFVISVK